jgi:hypothetical protein
MTVMSGEEEKKVLLVVDDNPTTFTWCTRF